MPVGIIDERTDQLLRVTENALARAISAGREGRRVGDICAEIEDEARRSGFSVVREFVGHGVGRKMHEEPQIPNYGKRGSGPKLKAGMTLAIEPMINIGTSDVRLLDDGWTVRTADGMPSAHFEHTVLITKDDPEILTWDPRPDQARLRIRAASQSRGEPHLSGQYRSSDCLLRSEEDDEDVRLMSGFLARPW